MLFNYLNDDLFQAFSRRHKHLYAACLLSLHDRYFSDVGAFPTPQEVTHAIYDVMSGNPGLWSTEDDFSESLPEIISTGRRRVKRASATKSEAGDKALGIARQIYGGLLAWGWLEEEEYGLRVTVDMPMGPLLVVQRLASLDKDVSQRFGGLIVTIRLNLDAISKLNPAITDQRQRDAALTLREARNQVEQFARSLRAILSDLKRIRRNIMESKTVGDRLEAFFKEFVEQMLLRDFESILTFNHPYRYRDEIIDQVRRVINSHDIMQVLAEEYLAANMSQSQQEALEDVEADLLTIENTFALIGEMFERIELFRKQLEARLKNTIKYSERGSQGLVGRAGSLVRRFDALLGRDGSDVAAVEWSLEPLQTPWSEFHQAKPRQPRKPVVPQALADRPVDEMYDLRKALRLEYISRMSPSPNAIRDFLRSKVQPAGTSEARFLSIDTVDEFIAFFIARGFAMTQKIPEIIADEFELTPSPDTPPHDSEWMRCSNFVISRRPKPLRK